VKSFLLGDVVIVNYLIWRRRVGACVMRWWVLED
jgi:hypothetical protein